MSWLNLVGSSKHKASLMAWKCRFKWSKHNANHDNVINWGLVCAISNVSVCDFKCFLIPFFSIFLSSSALPADLRHCDALGSGGSAKGPGSSTGCVWTPALPVCWPGRQNGLSIAESLLHHSKLSRGHAWASGVTGTNPFTAYSQNGYRRRGTHDPRPWVRNMS